MTIADVTSRHAPNSAQRWRLALIGLLGTALVALAGCASTVAGTAVRGASGGGSGLDVTAYPTTDYPPDDASPDRTQGSYPPVAPSAGDVVPTPTPDSGAALPPRSEKSAGSGRPTASAPASGSQPAARSPHVGVATVTDGVVSLAVGEPDKTITIYQDPMCPLCTTFQQRWGEDIDKAIDAGELKVDLVTMTFLDRQSPSGDYSTRAATALLAVATTAGGEPGVVQDFQAALFSPDVMPPEGGTTDLTDQELAAIAVEAGLPASDAAAVAKPSAQVRAAAKAAADKALQRTQGTPSVFDGSGIMLDISDPQWLATVLEK